MLVCASIHPVLEPGKPCIVGGILNAKKAKVVGERMKVISSLMAV